MRLHYLRLALLFVAGSATLFSDGEEAGARSDVLERIIQHAYLRCFRSFTVSGKAVLVRMPFAQEEVEAGIGRRRLTVAGGGKGDPSFLWRAAEAAVASADFGGSPLLAGADIGDYLAREARIGLDCSGFVWFVLSSIAQAAGGDLESLVARELGLADARLVRLHVSASFFDPRNPWVREVPDEPRNLRPADLILFRGKGGSIVHSAVIKSVDRAAGRIRYLQCTDIAPQVQRGVHESWISFEPDRPHARLTDASVVWHQRLEAPSSGDPPLRFRDDGERYRAESRLGSGTVVRLRVLEELIESLAPGEPAWHDQAAAWILDGGLSGGPSPR